MALYRSWVSLLKGCSPMPRRRKPSGRRARLGEPRSSRDLSRRPGRKQPRRRLVIVCEGAETEPRYFHALRQKYRLSTLTVQVVARKGSPKSVVAEAIKQQGDLDDSRDVVWCVFDVESRANNPSFGQAVNRAKGKDLKLAVSNPAFEYWYILHFECTDGPFQDAADAVRKLADHLPGYSKAASVFKELEPRMPQALHNAESLRNRAYESWDHFPNPSTGVDQLVREICHLADQGT